MQIWLPDHRFLMEEVERVTSQSEEEDDYVTRNKGELKDTKLISNDYVTTNKGELKDTKL